jgi:hypothetical protein
MTLETLQELFERVQSETELSNLIEHKFNLSIEIGKLHIALHDGNSSSERSNTIALINASGTLETIINDKIQEIKQSKLDDRRRLNTEQQRLNKDNKKALHKYNIQESNLALAAKRVLNRSTYKAIIKVAEEMSHSKINKLKQRDLPFLILNVTDNEQVEN